MPRLSRVLLAGVCLGLVVSGCSGDDPGAGVGPSDSSSAAATPSPTATSSPTPTGPVEPTLPAAAEGSDAAAAEAFVGFYWEMADYAQATGDVEGLRRMGSETCEPCRTAVAFVEEAYRDGGEVRGGQTTLSGIRSSPLLTRSGRAIQVKLEVSSSDQVVDHPGKAADERYPGGTVRASFVVTHGGENWLVSYWEVS